MWCQFLSKFIKMTTPNILVFSKSWGDLCARMSTVPQLPLHTIYCILIVGNWQVGFCLHVQRYAEDSGIQKHSGRLGSQCQNGSVGAEPEIISNHWHHLLTLERAASTPRPNSGITSYKILKYYEYFDHSFLNICSTSGENLLHAPAAVNVDCCEIDTLLQTLKPAGSVHCFQDTDSSELAAIKFKSDGSVLPKVNLYGRTPKG